MSMTLAHYLKDFSAPEPPPLSLDEGAFGDLSFEDDAPLLELPQPDPVDIEAERAQAHAEGYEAATRELSHKHAGEMLALEEAHQQAMRELMEKQTELLSSNLATGLEKLVSALAASIGEQAVTAIAPFLSDLLREKAVADLAALIQMAINEGEAGLITVHGPVRLFDLLKAKMPDHLEMLRHVEADDLDLSVDVNDSALVTRISAWTASLKKVLE
ncbi:hypothetical protein ACQ3G6_00140 [Allorhizobium undicola]|uniref:hypothetical protein n=1 Tax=Allorhizobium undicola TaxID=78527 RepID=UPI003D334E00